MKRLQPKLIFNSIMTLAVLCLGLNLSAAQTYEDMVLASYNGRLFYIDIFETSCAKAKTINRSCDWGSDIDYKPVYFSYSRAKAYCEASGKRLPTIFEWYAAAKNGRKDVDYSLRENKLKDSSGEYLANVYSSKVDISGGKIGSLAPNNIEGLGIDDVGTVGMTGNRPEWITNADDTGALCGGGYQDKSDENFKLSLFKVCQKVTEDAERAKGTPRCVVDYSDDIQITWSANVTGELATYLKFIENKRFVETHSENSTLDIRYIQENSTQKLNSSQFEERLQPLGPDRTDW